MIIKQNRSKARTRKEKKKSMITSMVFKKTVKKLREKRKESYCWQPRNDRKNKLQKVVKKERWIDVHKLQMKEAVFLIIDICDICLKFEF